MKEIRAYIQSSALASLVKTQNGIPICPMTVSEHEGLCRENIEPDSGKIYVADVLNRGKIWRGGDAS